MLADTCALGYEALHSAFCLLFIYWCGIIQQRKKDDSVCRGEHWIGFLLVSLYFFLQHHVVSTYRRELFLMSWYKQANGEQKHHLVRINQQQRHDQNRRGCRFRVCNAWTQQPEFPQLLSVILRGGETENRRKSNENQKRAAWAWLPQEVCDLVFWFSWMSVVNAPWYCLEKEWMVWN